MIAALRNCLKIPDLRRKIFITLFIIAVYRLGCFVPTPGINGAALSTYFEKLAKTSGGTLFGFMNLFSGGALSKMTIFGLGIMPYISASIIMQLLTAVVPFLEKLSKEGKVGHMKINQYTRILAVGLCLLQGYFIALWLENPARFFNLVIVENPGWQFRVITMLTLTCGTMFVMWLGEQIQERGIGNGISLIITISIISRIPSALQQMALLVMPGKASAPRIDPLTMGILLSVWLAMLVAVVLVTQAQRRVPIQYARRIVGRRVYGGTSTFLPIRVDQAGVIAIIFAQSVILFPATISTFFPSPKLQAVAQRIFQHGVTYNIMYAILIVFFMYFYTAMVFNPIEISNNLKKYGGFIPGIRPGDQTARYLDYVVSRITFAGALYITFVATFPDMVMRWFKLPSYGIASFFGGTTLLIVVGVTLDTMRQIESQLLLRHYDGFTATGRLRSRR